MSGSHAGTRVLLALGVIFASLVTLPYVLRAWPGLPWQWVRFVFVILAIVFVVIADRVYVRRQRRGRSGTDAG